MTKPCVLIIDDEANLVSSVAYGLGAHGFDGIGAGTGAEGLAVAEKRHPNAILLDQKLPDASGIDLIAPLRSLDDRVAIIMISAHGDIPTAVEAVRRGAYDFVTKPFELDDLIGVLRSALNPGGARVARAARPALAETPAPFQVEVSSIMRDLRATVAVVAKSSARIVLLLGASGVGKGFTARARSRCQPARRWAVHHRELRLASRRSARIGAFRGRARSFHRGRTGASGPCRGGARRHAVSR